MATVRPETKESYETLKTDLKALRDELRLKAHLANMDLKAEWDKLEPKVEKVWSELSEASVDAAKNMKQHILKLRKRLAKN